MPHRSGRSYVVVVLGALALLTAAACSNDTTSPRPAAVTDIAGGGPAACMRTATGATVCPTASAAGTQAAHTGWQLVSVGGEHTCALKTTGDAYCWGSNRDGQLGVSANLSSCGTGQGQYPCSPAPRQVLTGARFSSMSAGARHTCAITAAGAPLCWGANDRGQVGAAAVGAAPGMLDPAGVAFIQISAGFSHSCAVRADGAVFCWGANDRGELGNGLLADQDVPARVLLPAPAASVSAGQERTCARTTANVVYCWGAVWTDCESGWEMSRLQPLPAPVPGAPAMGTVSVGSFTTCGSDASGAAYCWEANPRGEMGNGTQNGSVIPLRVASHVDLMHVSAGMVQSCGVAADGTGYCWGDDTFGELGVAPSSLVERCDRQGVACSTLPIAVSGTQRFVQISTGLGSHTCGVTIAGDVACWGLGTSGQRGDGTATYVAYQPTSVASPTP